MFLVIAKFYVRGLSLKNFHSANCCVGHFSWHLFSTRIMPLPELLLMILFWLLRIFVVLILGVEPGTLLFLFTFSLPIYSKPLDYFSFRDSFFSFLHQSWLKNTFSGQKIAPIFSCLVWSPVSQGPSQYKWASGAIHTLSKRSLPSRQQLI